MKPFKWLLCVVIALGDHALGQTVVQLVPGDSHPFTWLTSDQFELPMKCDADGNVYLRTTFGAVEITKIAPDGIKKAIFGPGVAEIKGESLYDFFVEGNGELYALLDGAEAVVVEFDSKGKFEHLTGLDIRLATGKFFRPAQFVVLPDGQFFISGVLASEGKAAKKTPFTGIFDANGKLVREVVFTEENSALARKDVADVPFGAYLLGADGNIYVVQKGSPLLAYVVSQSGRVLRTLKIQPPNPKYQPVDAKISDGHLAIEFQMSEASKEFKVTELLIRIADTETGKTLIDYEGSSLLTGTLACYTSDKFTFLTGNDHLALTEVATH